MKYKYHVRFWRQVFLKYFKTKLFKILHFVKLGNLLAMEPQSWPNRIFDLTGNVTKYHMPTSKLYRHLRQASLGWEWRSSTLTLWSQNLLGTWPNPGMDSRNHNLRGLRCLLSRRVATIKVQGTEMGSLLGWTPQYLVSIHQVRVTQLDINSAFVH